ncbi:MAG: GNAT family N-acetyltransferase [Candidatus Hydrogenedentes bacterium]|nr:GNAT family N-acetyltransferase [Candidatus Hydrogenedentota bacterium]
MRDRNIIIKGVESAEELHWANDCMAKIGRPDYFETLDWLLKVGGAYPGFKREHTRIAVVEGEVAAALRITSDTIRIGEARLRMGGFGYVSTVARHRGKGIASLLIQNAMHYLAEHGYHVAMLFGIPNFYHRFGFVSTLPGYGVWVDTRNALAVAPLHPFRQRKIKPGDIRSLQKMHEKNDGATPCSIIRTAAHFSCRWDQWKNSLVLLDSAGKVLAYCTPRLREGFLAIEEAGLLSIADAEGLLHACGELAQRHTLPRIRFSLPPQHPFAHFLLHHDSTHEMHITRNGEGMMAFVNPAEALEMMIPEWESLLQRHVAGAAHTEVTLLAGKKPYRIRTHKGSISIAPVTGQNKLSLSQAEFMQLFTGYAYLDDVLNERRRILTPEARALLDCLFPKRHAYVWPQDRF